MARDPVTLVPVRPALREAVLALATRPDQAHLVSDNARTLAQAADRPGAVLLAVMTGGQPVGLIAMIDPRTALPDDPGLRPDGVFIWRFMVDAAAQGRGIGGMALTAAKDIARDWGGRDLYLTHEDVADAAAPFYRGHGFVPTGRKVWGEVEMVCALDRSQDD